MSLVEIMLTRRSIRKFQQKEIPREQLNLILEAGQKAPSAMNKQPWHFIIVSDEKKSVNSQKGFLVDSSKTPPSPSSAVHIKTKSEHAGQKLAPPLPYKTW